MHHEGTKANYGLIRGGCMADVGECCSSDKNLEVSCTLRGVLLDQRTDS